MIDSIRTSLQLSQSEIMSIFENLENVEELSDKRTGEIFYKGVTSNEKLNITITCGTLFINGSLSQYYHESYKSLMWDEVILAIKKLEIELRVNLGDSKINGLDLEGTFVTIFKPNTYFEFFGDSPNYNRFLEKNTLYYNSGTRKKKFYNKSKKNFQDTKVKTDSNNLLRFEITYKSKSLRSFSNKINIEKLKLSDLKNPFVQTKLTELWFREYNSIMKNNLKYFDLNEIKGLADVKTKLIIDQVNLYGGIYEFCNALKRSNNSNINSKTLYRIKKGLEEMKDSIPQSQEQKHIQDVNYKVKIFYESTLDRIFNHNNATNGDNNL